MIEKLLTHRAVMGRIAIGALLLGGCATHSMTFYNGSKSRAVTEVHEKPMHLSLFNGMVEPNSVELGLECGGQDWVRIEQDDSYVNRYTAQKTDGAVTPKSITVYCGPLEGVASAPPPGPAQPPYPQAPGASR